MEELVTFCNQQSNELPEPKTRYSVSVSVSDEGVTETLAYTVFARSIESAQEIASRKLNFHIREVR